MREFEIYFIFVSGELNAKRGLTGSAHSMSYFSYAVSTTFLALDPDTGSSRKILGVSLTGTVPYVIPTHST